MGLLSTLFTLLLSCLIAKDLYATLQTPCASLTAEKFRQSSFSDAFFDAIDLYLGVGALFMKPTVLTVYQIIRALYCASQLFCLPPHSLGVEAAL
jgi:hypothetical protein